MRNWWTAALATSLAPLLVMANAQAESLPEAIEAAYANNPTLQAARAQARATDEAFAQARSGFLPTLDANAAYTTQDSEIRRDTPAFPGGPLVTESSQQPYSYGFRLSQPLYAGGRRTASVRQANAQIDSAQEGLRATEQGVFLSAVAAFVDVRRDEELVRIRGNNVDVLTRQLQAAKDRFEVGEITKTDVAQAEARLAGAGSQLAAARADLAASRAQYERVIGRPPGSLEAPPTAPAMPKSLSDAIDTALANSPDIERFRLAEKVAKEQVAIEAAGLKPQVALVGRFDRQYDSIGRGIENDVASATAQVSIPLFEGGFARSRVRQSKINLERARAQTEETRRAVVSQVTNAWNDLVAAQDVTKSSREQERAAKLAFDGAQQELDVGLRTTLDLLNAQQEYLEAQLAVARADRNAYVAAHALLLSVGGLDARTLGVNGPLYDPDKHRKAVRMTILSTKPVDAR